MNTLPKGLIAIDITVIIINIKRYKSKRGQSNQALPDKSRLYLRINLFNNSIVNLEYPT